MATQQQLSDPCCLNPLGDWDRLTVYSPLDLVTLNGSSYVAVTSNVGDEPTFYSATWMLLAEKGDTAQLNPRGQWQPSVIYEPLDVVSYQGSSWIARRESIGRAPAENSFWMLLAERGPSMGVMSGGGGGGVGPPGPQGPQGDPGATGAQGDPGPQNLFIQNAAPVTIEPTYLWIQTEIGLGNDFTFWIEDGV